MIGGGVVRACARILDRLAGLVDRKCEQGNDGGDEGAGPLGGHARSVADRSRARQGDQEKSIVQTPTPSSASSTAIAAESSSRDVPDWCASIIA